MYINPKVMRVVTLIFFIMFLIIYACAAQMTKNEFYDSLNTIRKQNDLPALKRSPMLELSAYGWLTKLQRHRQGLQHDFKTDGEVLTDSWQYLASWMTSPRHRKVLMIRRFRKIGLAERDGVYCARLR